MQNTSYAFTLSSELIVLFFFKSEINGSYADEGQFSIYHRLACFFFALRHSRHKFVISLRLLYFFDWIGLFELVGKAHLSSNHALLCTLGFVPIIHTFITDLTLTLQPMCSANHLQKQRDKQTLFHTN